MSVVQRGTGWSATPDAPTITPSGVVANDLLLLHILGDGNVAHGFGTPAGWTLLASGSNADFRVDTYVKRATGAENAGVVLPTVSSTPGLAVLQAFLGTDDTTPYDAATYYTWEYDGVTSLVEDLPGVAGVVGDLAAGFIGWGYASIVDPSINPPFSSALKFGSGSLDALCGVLSFGSSPSPDLTWSLGSAVGAHGTDAVSNLGAILLHLIAAASPVLTGGAAVTSGFVSLEPGLHFHVASSGLDPQSWSVDLGDGSAPITGTFSGPGPFDVDLTGSDIYTVAGVYTATLTVTNVDASTETFTFPTVDALAVFATPAGAAATDTSATGVIELSQPATLVSFEPTDYGYVEADLPSRLLYPPSPMVQRHLSLTRAPWTIKDGVPVDPPILGAMSRSVAYARSWSSTANLGAEAALGLMGATARWLADTADIGSTIRWHPHFGSAPDWVFSVVAPSLPYVDPDYRYFARDEQQKLTQAMIFDGTSWAQFAGASSQAAFTFLVVAALKHGPNRGYWDILASLSAATDPDRATDTALRYDSGYLRAYAPARLASAPLHPPIYHGRVRPTIMIFGMDAHYGVLGVVDGLGRHWAQFAHPVHAGYDLRMKMAMNGGVNDQTYAGTMDVLDVMYWNSRRTASQLVPVVTKLDGVYGVTGR